MRLFILVFLALAGITGCSSYQYMTVDSSELKKNAHRQLTWENDTLKLIYDFNGYGGPIRLYVYNKTSQPLYVNWKKSALIRNRYSIGLFNPNVAVNGDA